MRIISWLIRAIVFFGLFAFALNNQHEAYVRWVFGQQWHAPMVFIVLAAFALGCALGAMAMAPSWWRHQRAVRREAALLQPKPTDPCGTPAPIDAISPQTPQHEAA
jgi:lipopolysaccharide assembly protein A